jgi:tetratricopeptide (TPR) repeat protein
MATKTGIPSPSQPANPTGEIPAARVALQAPAQAWHINLRLLVWTLVALVVTVPLLFLWYNVQHSHHATAILDRARALHQQEDWRNAAVAFHQYLRLRPKDAEALILRAQTFDKLAVEPDQRQQAASLYLQAIRANPDRHDLRLRRAELLYETGRYIDAADEAEKVRKALDSGSAEATTSANSTQPAPSQPALSQIDRLVVDRLYAAAFRDQRVLLVDTVRVFEEALQAHPGDIVLSVGLAQLLNKHADSLPGEQRDAALFRAEQVIDEVVTLHPGDPQALLARYRYQTAQAQRDPGANLRVKRNDTRIEDLASLLKAAPDDPDVLIVAASALAEQAAADALKAASQTDATAAAMLKSSAEEYRVAARGYAARLLEVAPQDRRSYSTVAAVYSRLNESQKAIEDNFKDVSVAARRRILCDNARELYGLN